MLYAKNSVYPIVKDRKFTVHAQYHVICAQGVPKTARNNFFYPELSIHYTTFMGLRWRLRVVLYWSIRMLKRFSAAKKPSPVKLGPQNGGFSEI